MQPMVEPERKSSSFAIPPRPRVSLPEVVELIAGEEFEPDDVWGACLEALCDGRLVAGDPRPEYFRSLPCQEFALRGMPQADLDAIRSFAAIPSSSWRSWVTDKSIVRVTGDVLRPVPDSDDVITFRPMLPRVDVLVHFRAAKPAASEKAAPPKPLSSAVWAANALRRMKATGEVSKATTQTDAAHRLAQKCQLQCRPVYSKSPWPK
jgi:hypothetical protein